MKKPGVVPGFDDSRQAPDGANPRRGAHTLPRYAQPYQTAHGVTEPHNTVLYAPHTALPYPV